MENTILGQELNTLVDGEILMEKIIQIYIQRKEQPLLLDLGWTPIKATLLA